MKKLRKYKIDAELLKSYYLAALENAKLLLDESHNLLELESYARSYFLACASIEETGKALMAFFGLGRNLNNPGTQSSLKMSFEDHSAKILNSFGVLFMELNPEKNPNDTRKFLLQWANLCVALETGREKSMYVDVKDNGEVSIPNQIVSKRNAEDSLRLSTDLLKIAERFVLENKPPNMSETQDQFHAIPTRKLKKMIQSNNFIEFLMEKVNERGKLEGLDGIKLMLDYYQQYFCKNELYIPKKINYNDSLW